ncbi:ion channel [Brevundimonas sp.]|uniref:ion channel n=1 Tax=Brevundimonas sp. TaxID=1871086 RepID=UPI002FC97062
MILSIILGLLAMSACLALQASTLTFAVRYFAWAAKRRPAGYTARGDFFQLSTMMVCLMVGTLIQILIWALLYRSIGAFQDFETAAYFSAVTFTTLGYGDVLLEGRFRFLAPFQGASGVMMFALSSAALLAAVQHAVTRRVESKRAVGSISPTEEP